LSGENRKGYKKYAGADVHRKVINAYKNSIHKNEQNIGRILDKLRKARNDADYDDDILIDIGLAQRIVVSAKLILNRLGIPLK
jgi:arylsulfatase A-like enzyme